MALTPRKVVLLQLPIPPAGPGPLRGNVPLAAGYLKLLAAARGLEAAGYQIEIFPPRLANTLGDLALVEAILDRRPWMVGLTCYLWNIERSLWVAEELKRRQPDLRILLGGPEITADNAWVLGQPAVDFAAIGEGEQTFCELLEQLLDRPLPTQPIDGLYVNSAHRAAQGALTNMPPYRRPLANLNDISSPYLTGILDAAEEEMLLLETIRGCVFKCKFCYYPKSYDALYFLSQEKLIANLQYARQSRVREVVLLDPTLNQRKDFADFLRLLQEQNPDGQFTYFGELRAEGIDAKIARLLRQANFTEVEIGLQSIDPRAQQLMDRNNNLRAFERGVRSMLDAGIEVKIDLIIGLPGDTAESVRRGMHYLRDSGLYSSVQVFNLAVLPGTAFRQEASALGLNYQPRPPYYVTETLTLEMAEMLALMDEAQELFGVEFDALPSPMLKRGDHSDDASSWHVDLDGPRVALPPAGRRAQCFTLWLSARDFQSASDRAVRFVEELLADNPHTTLQVVLEPTLDARSITRAVLSRLLRACYARPTYLDKFYAVLPGPPKGAKRLIIVLPLADRAVLGTDWIEAAGEFATLVWRGEPVHDASLEAHEFVMA